MPHGSIVLRGIEQALPEQSPGSGPDAQIGAVAFIHPVGATLNEHTPFHIGVIDGVFAGAKDDSPIAFVEATAMDAPTVAAAQPNIRRRVLRRFVRHGSTVTATTGCWRPMRGCAQP